MVSFDVISLFASIPQDKAINTMQRLLNLQEDEHNKDNEPSMADILEMLTFSG